MPTCPRCHQAVDSQAIACPYCRTALKAHGHPGIPLYRAEGKQYLCETCTYHEDDSCNFPQRPYAKECTLYQDCHQPIQPIQRRSAHWQNKLRIQGNEGWLILAGLLGVSFLIAISNKS